MQKPHKDHYELLCDVEVLLSVLIEELQDECWFDALSIARHSGRDTLKEVREYLGMRDAIAEDEQSVEAVL